MIEFNGYLNGDALKYHQKRTRGFGLKILIIAFVLFIPVIGTLAWALKQWFLLALYPIPCLLGILSTYIPNSKKEQMRGVPNRIFTEDDCIVRVAYGKEDFKLIADAGKVIDHGEFYEVVFPMGNASPDYICQKNLLAQGTIEEFEALFAGKIIRQ